MTARHTAVTVRLTRTLAALATIASIASAASADLVNRYSFDGTGANGTVITDSVGGADGVLREADAGASALTGTGQVNLAGGSSATAGYVDLPNGIVSSLTDATFEGWFVWDGGGNWQRLYDFGANTAGEVTAPGGAFTGNDYTFFSPKTGAGPARFVLKNGSEQNVDTGALATATAYHVAVTFDSAANTAKLYVNGGLASTNAGVTHELSALTDVNNWIGRSNWSGDPNFDGTVDEFRIYDSARTATQVLSDYKLGANVLNSGGLVHRWSFNETGGSGTVLVDSVGGLNGSIVEVGANDATVGSGKVTMAGGARASSDYVNLGAGAISSYNAVTLETWATRTAVQSWARLFSINDGSTTNDSFFLSWNRAATANTQRFERVTDWGVDTGAVIADNTRYHVTVTWDADGFGPGVGKASWYLDGKLVTTVNTGGTNPLNQVDSVFWLGRSAFGGDNTASATYDEVRVYAEARSNLQIHADRLIGPDHLNDANFQRVTNGWQNYATVNLAAAVGNANINYDTPNLAGGLQTLGGIPFDIADVGGNNAWHSQNAGGDGSDIRSLVIPINVHGVIEVHALLNTWWGEQVAGQFASLIFTAASGETLEVLLDGNNELRDFLNGGFANLINNVTTTAVITNGNERVDMTRIILPDEWAMLTLATITLEDRGASGFQRTFISGLTLTVIPAPAALPAGLALIGLASMRRRRR